MKETRRVFLIGLSFIALPITLGYLASQRKMSSPIQVVGVYKLPVTPELVSVQANELYGTVAKLTQQQRTQAEREAREQLESLVLIECLVSGADKRFDVGDFTQRQPGVDRSSWQAAYGEVFLSADGETRLDVQWGQLPKQDPFRVAFYLYFWDSHEPLVTSYGDVRCPDVGEMPERLQRLAPFSPVD
jgi:hypothetical protein